jgi:hypothetical protein
MSMVVPNSWLISLINLNVFVTSLADIQEKVHLASRLEAVGRDLNSLTSVKSSSSWSNHSFGVFHLFVTHQKPAIFYLRQVIQYLTLVL